MVMGCCGSKDNVIPIDIKNDHDDGSTAPERKRKCTDVVFFLLFAAALGGIGYVAFHAVQNGDPERYIRGVDSWGNVCGRKKNVPIRAKNTSFASDTLVPPGNVTNSGKDRSNHTYELNFFLSDLSLLLKPDQLLFTNSSPIVLCISECPQEVSSCPDLLVANGYVVDEDIVDRRICQMPGKYVPPHEAILNRCVPKHIAKIGNGITEAGDLGSRRSTPRHETSKDREEANHRPRKSLHHIHDIISSVTDNWRTILYLLLIALGMSFMTIIMLQLFTRLLVITILVVSVLGTGAVSGYIWYEYLVSVGVVSTSTAKGILSNVTSETKRIIGLQLNVTEDIASAAANFSRSLSFSGAYSSEQLLSIAIVATIFTLVSWFVLIWTRKSLKLVISLFDEASLAIFSMPTILIQPLKTVVALAVAFAGFLVVSAFLLSDQEPKVDDDGIVTFVDRPTLKSGKILLVPVVFVFLWVFEFIFACHEIILAGAVSSWYFTRGKEKNKCSCKLCAIVRPTLDLVFYNLGTAACGSLIIAILQFIRLVLAYLQKKLKKSDSKTAKFCLTCLQCCLGCFEKILKFINRNAYIVVAIYGDGFCTSAKKAVSLLVSNAQHVMALNCVSGFCLLLGKITVVAVVGVIGSAWFRSSSSMDLKFIFPMAIACLGAFFIGSCFMSVFGMAIDTIFLCFCDDHQRNNGADRPYYSSKSLQKFMDAAKSRKNAAKQQPDSSAGPLNFDTRQPKQKKKITKRHKSGSSPSFTRINIPDRDSFSKPSGTKRSKVHPLPEVSEP